MSTYKIHNGAPPSVGTSKYPLRMMKANQYFDVPVDPNNYESWTKTYNRLLCAICAYQRKTTGTSSYKGTWMVRKVRDENVVRCWKLK